MPFGMTPPGVAPPAAAPAAPMPNFGPVAPGGGGGPIMAGGPVVAPRGAPNMPPPAPTPGAGQLGAELAARPNISAPASAGARNGLDFMQHIGHSRDGR